MPYDEHSIRSSVAPLLDAAKVDSLLSQFIAGTAFVVQPPPPKSRAQFEAAVKKAQNGTRKNMTCFAVQMASPEAAKSMLGMTKKEWSAQEEVLSKKWKTTVVKDGTLKVKGDLPNVRRSRVLDDGHFVLSDVSVLFVRESVLAGCAFNSTPFEDDVLVDFVADFSDALAKAAPKKAK